MRKVSQHNVSARHKFKDSNTLEIVVMDHTDGTQATWLINWKSSSIERVPDEKKKKKDSSDSTTKED